MSFYGSPTHISLHSRRPWPLIAYQSSWPSSNVYRSFIRRTRLFSLHNAPFTAFYSYRSRSCRGQMWRDTCAQDTTSSPDLSCLMTNTHNSSCLAPPRSQFPGSLVFMCFTRVRASPYATYVASIRCVVLRAPRSSRSFLHPISSATPCQSVTVVFSVFLSSIPALTTGVVSLYLIINHLFGTSASSGLFARCRTQARNRGRAQPSGDDRGCVTWAPMGGSTVP